jgi:DNA-binding NarL/FixJ family response regulator
MLRDLGCMVAGNANKLDDALHKARTANFDVALLDVNIGGKRVDRFRNRTRSRNNYRLTTLLGRKILPIGKDIENRSANDERKSLRRRHQLLRGLMSKYREAFLIWLTVVAAICGTVVVIRYTSESCHAYEASIEGVYIDQNDLASHPRK